MATYHAIAVTGQAVIGLLIDACPRAEFPSAQFQLYEANDFSATMDEGISLYLYRVATSTTRRNLPARTLPDGRHLRTPLPVDLHYLLTPWARTAVQQHHLLGWAMRALEDTPILPASFLNQYSAVPAFWPNETIEFVPEPLSIQDMNNIWNGFKPNMYPSVGYVTRLVAIESTTALSEASPVQTREFQMGKLSAT